MDTVIKTPKLSSPPLTINSDGTMNAKGIYNIDIPSIATDPLKITLNDGSVFSWTPTELVYKDDSGQMDYIAGSSPSRLSVMRNQVKYDRTFPSADDIFNIEGDKVKHWVILNQPPRAHADYLTGNVYFGVSGLVSGVPLPTGAHDSINCDSFNLPKPLIKDLNGNEIDGHYEVVDSNDGQHLFIWFDTSFLDTATYPVMIDPTVVVNSAYDTSGNGGRKLVELSNGWLVISVFDSSLSYIRMYVSKDKGSTWNQLCYSALTNHVDHSISCVETNIYLMGLNSSGSYLWYFDATTITNTSLATPTVVDNNQNTCDKISTTINLSGTELHSAWSSKNTTYPNSYNIHYAKGTINGDGSVTWGTVEQVTTANNTYTTGYQNPTLSGYITNGKALIIYDYSTTSSSPHENSIGYSYYDGTQWQNKYDAIDSGGFTNSANYPQSHPSAIFVPSSVNGLTNGRIWVVWQGTDSTDINYYNIRASYSDDGGNTWSNTSKLTSGNAYSQLYPSISYDRKNKIYVTFQGIDSAVNTTYSNIRQITNNNGTWSSVSALTNNTTANDVSPSMLIDDSTGSLVAWIWQDNQAGAVQFDKIIINQPPNAPILSTKSNFDATDSSTFNWTYSDPDTNDHQSAYQLQIVDSSSGSVVFDSGKTASTTSLHNLAANTLTNDKQYQWKVRTWDSSDVVGVYSSLSSFYTSAKPSVAITYPANNSTFNGSSLTVQWSFSDPESGGQSAYQVRLLDSTNTEIENTGKLSSTSARSKTLSSTISNNTSYKVEVTVWDDKDVQSNSVTNIFSVSYTQPQVPTIVLSQDSTKATVTVTVTNPTPQAGEPSISTNQIYRRKYGEINWNYLGSASSSFVDYQCPNGTYEYSAIAVADNGTHSNRSDVQSITLSFDGWWIVDTNTNETFQFLYNLPDTDLSTDEARQEVQTFSTKPFVRYSNLNTHRGSLSGLQYSNTSSSTRDYVINLENLVNKRTSIYLKNDVGDSWTVNLYNFKRNVSTKYLAPNSKYVETVSVEWVEV